MFGIKRLRAAEAAAMAEAKAASERAAEFSRWLDRIHGNRLDVTMAEFRRLVSTEVSPGWGRSVFEALGGESLDLYIDGRLMPKRVPPTLEERRVIAAESAASALHDLAYRLGRR